MLLAALFATLSPAIEAPIRTDVSVATRLGLHRSQGVVARLAALFALDAFAGGFVIQSIVSFWFATRFGLLDPARSARSSSPRTSWRASRRSSRRRLRRASA